MFDIQSEYKFEPLLRLCIMYLLFIK